MLYYIYKAGRKLQNITDLFCVEKTHQRGITLLDLDNIGKAVQSVLKMKPLEDPNVSL